MWLDSEKGTFSAELEVDSTFVGLTQLALDRLAMTVGVDRVMLLVGFAPTAGMM
jgi:hypothetical protein